MALIECPECSTKVSDSAPMCPACGFEVKKHITEYLSRQPEQTTLQIERKQGSVKAAWYLLLVALIVIIPLIYTKTYLLVSVSMVFAGVLLILDRERFSRLSWVLLLRPSRLSRGRIVVRSGIAIMLFIYTVSLFGSKISERYDLKILLSSVDSKISNGELENALSELMKHESKFFWPANARDLGKKTDVVKSEIQAAEVIKEEKRLERLNFEHSRELDSILASVDFKLAEKNYSAARSLLEDIEAYSYAGSFREANLLRHDLEMFEDEKFLINFLASISDDAWGKMIDSDYIMFERFTTPSLNSEYQLSLNQRIEELNEIRTKTLVERAEEEARKFRMKNNILYARTKDNIRSGPSTHNNIVRKTEEGEKLIFLSRNGSWYKLDSDSEEWVHESVVRTAQQNAQAVVASREDAKRRTERKLAMLSSDHDQAVAAALEDAKKRAKQFDAERRKENPNYDDPVPKSRSVRTEYTNTQSDDSPASGEKKIGKWLNQMASDFYATVEITARDGVYWMYSKYHDGSSQTTKLTKKKVSGTVRYVNTDSRFGEYYIITPDGRLKIYDNEGLIRTASKI